MYSYRVAFMVKEVQLNAWFISPEKYKDDEDVKQHFRERAVQAALAYIKEARNVPTTGQAEAFAIWPEILPMDGPLQPIDAFEIKN